MVGYSFNPIIAAVNNSNTYREPNSTSWISMSVEPCELSSFVLTKAILSKRFVNRVLPEVLQNIAIMPEDSFEYMHYKVHI